MKATYYGHLSSPHEHEAKENKDGTVDLHDASGTLKVGSCPLSDTPKVGHAVLVKEGSKEEKKEPSKPAK
jgi:hypothetical protein